MEIMAEQFPGAFSGYSLEVTVTLSHTRTLSGQQRESRGFNISTMRKHGFAFVFCIYPSSVFKSDQNCARDDYLHCFHLPHLPFF